MRISESAASSKERLLETALYPPVKRFLEQRGFVVKGEIGGCDLLGIREGEPPLLVVGELKQAFSLELVLQAVDRASACDEVWIAARMSKRGKGREADARFRNLCRRLGFGMLGIFASGRIEILVEAAAVFPRRNAKRRSRLIQEHQKRRGDPALGGSTRAPIMTAYRQEALLCAAAMVEAPRKPKDLRVFSERAASILQTNVYGWFMRVERGLYALTDEGRKALVRWPQESAEASISAMTSPELAPTPL